jgi:hypothetical protein
MGNAYLYGNGGSSGGSLGFEIVGGTIRPARPSHNMVWVNTNVDITSYVFSATAPENPVEGMLWVTIADSSNTKSVFTVGKEWVTVYTVSTKQYIGGAWIDKFAHSYQNGEWVDWWLGELYEAGNECAGITGGWIAEAIPIGSSIDKKELIVTRNSTNMVISGSPGYSGIVRTKNKITIASSATLYLDATVSSDLSEEHDEWCDLFIWSEIGTTYTENVVAYLCLEGVNESNLFAVPVPKGEYYIGFGMHEDYSTITMRKLHIK